MRCGGKDASPGGANAGSLDRPVNPSLRRNGGWLVRTQKTLPGLMLRWHMPALCITFTPEASPGVCQPLAQGLARLNRPDPGCR
eukprot:1030025-Prymnesium_polylepis.2